MAVQVEQLITEHLDLWTQAQTAKSTSGRGSNNKIELTGIKKLRELILELAVRGQLVPQDPNDESASELLKRIAAEREKLVEAGDLKKQKKLSSSGDKKKPFKLPAGWVWARLPEVCHYQVGKTPSTKNSLYWANGSDAVQVPWVSISDLNHNSDVVDTERKITHMATKEVFKCGPASAGDILMSFKLTVGKVSILQIDAFHNEAIISIKTGRNIDKKYLFAILPARALDGNTKGAIKGKTLNSESIADISIPLPPLPEQVRIVTKLDELMALCDQLEQQSYQQVDAHNQLVDALLATLTQSQNADELASNWQRLATHFDTLFTTEYSIDALKQTILQLAVMGKLVKQDPNDEPASELLKRIAAEKDALVKAGKIKKQKPLPPISEDEKPFELPDGWEWCRLDNLSLSSEAGWSPQCDNVPRENINWGVLKVSAVTWGSYNENENKALPSHLDPRPEFEVKPHDFLISRANTADLVARAVVVPDDAASNLMLSDKIIRFKFSELISSNYVNLVNSSFHARHYYSQVAGGTSSSMKNVSRVQIQNLVIPLPPLSEQEKILIKVNELGKICDGLVCKLISVKQTQAILAHALVELVVA